MQQEASLTTFILDEKWPEFDTYINGIATNSDYFIVPLRRTKFIKTDRYSWVASNTVRTRATTWQGVYRALKLRFSSKGKNNVFQLNIQLDRNIACEAAKQIPIESTHIVISQNLLPFVYESGALGGRTFDVLMTRLPMEKLHERLDFAHSLYNDSPTLKDFRAPSKIIDLENKALTKARKIITTHSDIASIFHNKVEKLRWELPEIKNRTFPGDKVLFPASAVARKGAYEIRKLGQELNLEFVISGNAVEKDNFWEGLKIEKFNGNFDEIGLVVYPTYIEHQPRQILKAISEGIPVITTRACGIDSSEKIKIIEIGNYEELRNEVCSFLSKMT